MRRQAFMAVLAATVALVAVPSALGSWLSQDSPPPSGADVWHFNGVSCTSKTVCTAVGSYEDSSGTHPLAENRSGTTWTIVSVPVPTGGVAAELTDVACTSANACIAVGRYAHSGNTLTLAERWNGASWSVQATPNPAGATASELDGIACTSATACIAVGHSSDGATTTTLAERWNGASWSIQSSPNPAGATLAQLNGVSCTSASACTAVGESSDGTTIVTLAERWNGTSWTIQTTPNPSGATVSELFGVSCPSASACTAVGSGLAERWNGVSWSLQQIAKPKGVTPADLNGVSCASPTACTAVGGFYNEDAVLTLVAEAWNGTSWKIQPTPISTANDSSVLNDVTCATSTACTAVGSYHNPVTGDRALVEVFALRWQLDFPDVPFDAIASSFKSVSCTSATKCMAVGGYEGSGSTFVALAERWDGTSWTILSTPNPTVSNLEAVSCTSANVCTAVGDFQSGGNIFTLAERWNGVSWTTQSTPNPAGAVRSYLTGVSCSSATACTAVGFYVDGTGTELTLAERWNGTTWTIKSTLNQAGATSNRFTGVSCSSASACEAVGNFSPATSGIFAERWNGTSWAMQSVPTPTGGRSGNLRGVSCTSGTACSASGAYFDGTDVVTLVERWNGTTWAVQPSAIPIGAKHNYLAGISCPSAIACTSAGSWSKTGAISTFKTLAEHWNGTSWAVQSTPNPVGAQGTNFADVSCASPVTCTAVGWYDDSSGTETLLVEQYS